MATESRLKVRSRFLVSSGHCFHLLIRCSCVAMCPFRARQWVLALFFHSLTWCSCVAMCTPWRPTLSQASSSRDGGQAASQPPDLQPTALDTSNRDWRASSSHLWDGGQVALNNYVNQQPAHRSSYYQGDYKSAYFQGPAKSSSYKYERENDTESSSDPWRNWKPSYPWKGKKW